MSATKTTGVLLGNSLDPNMIVERYQNAAVIKRDRIVGFEVEDFTDLKAPACFQLCRLHASPENRSP